MDESINTAFSLDAEELQFCLSALQIEIEQVERTLTDSSVTPDERSSMEAYIHQLDTIQDQFLVENNIFRSIDLLKVYELVKNERSFMSDILDNEQMSPQMRRDGQQHLRTANSILRKLRRYFKNFEIDV